ncbi:GNAT family N-acetyltransferase [Ferrovibrio sp.]|uniref:GNAT family N-acetyltransferase n=1 Tax=Ferrovibrio sp. TaxID=1917215 RepID=UPI0026046FE5|nr:GNAT family N-acetyltransferase [Ferrovibrio sp.]
MRDADSAEADTIAALVISAYCDYRPSLTAENWQAMESGLSKAGRIEHAHNIVAECDGAMAGYVAYFPPGNSSPKLFEPAWASIRLLAVSPACRGQGLARLLTETCIERAQRDGAATIGLHTSEVMTRARALYERMGFREARELPAMFGLRYWQYRLDL